jgi:putative transcriptional regulator
VPVLQGQLLVAAEDLGDPNFIETVILLLEHNDEGSLGLVINRPTRVRLAELLPKVTGLTERDLVFRGGPVQPEAVQLLVGGSEAPDGSRKICEGVYVSTRLEVLEQLASGSRTSRPFRAYTGYAGWGPGQLAGEMDARSWHVLPSDSDAVFAAAPAALWDRLIERTRRRFAWANPVDRRRFVALRQAPSASISPLEE